MSDLICRKAMTRCQTPGMCAPHGGCSTSADAARAALVERAVAPAPASGVTGTIGVKRYIPEGYTHPASRSGKGTHMVECRDGDYVLASDYDALSQRCRELEAENSEFRKLPTCWSEVFEQTTELERAEFERDTLRAEVAQLRREASLYRFVRGLAWYVDRAASVYELGNSQSPWSSERQSVDADEVEAAIAAAMEELT